MDSFSNSGIEQVIGTVPGQSYALSFMYSPRPGVAANSNGVEVRVNGNVIDTIAQDGTGNANTVWTRFTYGVTASGSSTTIEFHAVGLSDGVGGYIDAVSFKGAPAAAVPALEPWALIGLSGLLMLAAAAVLALRQRTR